MLKLLFQYLTDSYALLENPVDNYVIMSVVGFVAFLAAYSAVEWLYDNHLISGGSAGSMLHWIIRFIVFVAIYCVFATIIRVYKWIVGLPTYERWIVFSVFFVIVAIVIMFKFMSLRKKELKK